MRDALLSYAKEATDKAEEMARSQGVITEKVIAEGNPSAEILRMAQEKEVDLLVVGSLGKTGLEKMMLGSVAEDLVRRSKLPVIVVPGNGD